MKKGMGEKIRQARREADLTQEELAKKVGVATPTVGNWEIGAFEPSSENLRKLSEVLHKPIAYFYGENSDNIESRVTVLESLLNREPRVSCTAQDNFIIIPLLDKAPAGPLEEAVEPDSAPIYLPKTAGYISGQTFALKVKDISLSPMIGAGDIIAVTKGIHPEEGDIVLVSVGGKVTIKKLGKSGKTKGITIIGKIIGAYKRF